MAQQVSPDSSIIEMCQALKSLENLRSTVSGISKEADERLEEATVLWQDQQPGLAYQILVKAIDISRLEMTKVNDVITGVRDAIEGGVTCLEDQKSQIAQLQQDVSMLKAKISKMSEQIFKIQADFDDSANKAAAAEQAKQTAEQKVLLGQVAYTFSTVFYKYVFPDDPDTLQPPSLRDVKASWDGGELTDVQKQRLRNVMSKAGLWQDGALTSKLMVQADLVLRKVRNQPAHVKWPVAKKVTSKQLKEWAHKYLETKQVPAVLQYIDALSKLSKDGCPLNFDVQSLPQV